MVLILASTWLAEFFFEEHYVDPIYTYFEFWLYFIFPVSLWIISSRLSSAKKKSQTRLKLEKDYGINDLKPLHELLR